LNDTKYRIINGAQQLFLDSSFHGTALDTLLGSINVSKGSFFHHFKSKDDLLLQLLDVEAQQLFSKLEEIYEKSSSPLSALNEFLSWRLESFSSNGRLIYKLGAEIGRGNPIIQKKLKKIYGEYLSNLMKLIDEAKHEDLLVKATPTKELANFILYGLEGGTMSMNITDSSDQYQSVVEMIKRVVRSYRRIDF
jgi:TetR/AcrR family transcriptional regulator, transcriptional repressor for nem operon